jgi:hypothetical protein
VSWAESKVYVQLARETIKNGPEYIESLAITREYESRLYSRYGLPPYWLHDAKRRPSLSLSNVEQNVDIANADAIASHSTALPARVTHRTGIARHRAAQPTP